MVAQQEVTAQKFMSHSHFFYWKNFIGTNIAGMLLCFPYTGFPYLLSSLYPEYGLGTWTVSVICGAQLISSVALPAVCKKMGYKGSLLLSSGLISVFVAANMLPSFATLMPAAALGGIGFAMMWFAMNTIVCDLALEYASVTGKSPATTLNLSMGILHTSLESSGIWINIIIALLIKQKSTDDILLPNNICGSNYCNEMESPSFMAKHVRGNKSLTVSSTIQSKTTVSTTELNSVCLVCLLSVALAAVIVATVCNFTKKSSEKALDFRSVVVRTLRMNLNNDILLLTMLASGAALVNAFYAGDFTKAFIACSVGVHYVGISGVTYYVSCTITSVVVGYIGRWTGNCSLTIVAVLMTLASIVTMFFWSPSSDSVIVLVVFSGVGGLTWGILATQLAVAYGENFKEDMEAAFSNQRMMQSLGITFGFAISHHLCFKTKMVIVMAWMLIGCVNYIIFEIRIEKQKLYSEIEEE